MMNRGRPLVVLLGVVLLATAAALLPRVAPAALAKAASNHNATRADFDRLMKELSNWGRWGKDDQMGAVNLITAAKRKKIEPGEVNSTSIKCREASDGKLPS
jgi:hypothetical protein